MGLDRGTGAKLLHLMAGSKVDTETVSVFFQDMRRRALRELLLIVAGETPGGREITGGMCRD